MVSEKRNNSDDPNETQPITSDGKYTFKEGGSVLGDSKNDGDTSEPNDINFGDEDLLEFGSDVSDSWSENGEGIPFKKYYDFNPYRPTNSMRLVNPKYYTNKEEYIRNCQRCYATFELRCRGYDVEAKESVLVGDDPAFEIDKDEKKRIDDIIMGSIGLSDFYRLLKAKSFSKRYITIFKGLNEEFADFNNSLGLEPDVESVIEAIDDIVRKGGEGSRYALSLEWKGGEGHICNVVNVGGLSMIFDSQSNRITSLSEYIGLCNTSKVFFGRIDNKEIDPKALGILMKEREE